MIATAIELAAIAVAYVALSMFLQRKLGDAKRMRQMQELIKAKSKELNDMAKAQASKAELEAKQKEVTDLLGQSMKSSFKPLIAVLPVFFILYYLILPMMFPHTLTFTIPVLSTVSYQTYFIVVAFITGIIASIVVMFWDKRELAREKQQIAQAEASAEAQDSALR
jgi:uncharacterized membrane protein (DUF106 family)